MSYTPQYQPSYQAAPAYGYAAPPAQDDEGLGSWVLTIFLSGIPLIGFIYLLILAFGSSSRPKMNYARATLIIGLIAWVLAIIAVIIFSTTVGFAALSFSELGLQE